MTEQKGLDRPELREIEKILFECQGYLVANGCSLLSLESVAKKLLALIPDVHYNAIKVIEEAKKQLIEHIEKNCKGYEDRTVGTLLDSKFWRTLKENDV